MDMWIRIGISYPIAWNDTILATYHRDSDARYRSFGVKKFCREPACSVTVTNAIQSGLVPPEKIQDLREYCTVVQYQAIPHLILNGNRELAIKIINQTRGTKKFRRQGWILLILAYSPLFLFNLSRQLYRSYTKTKIRFKNMVR